MSTDNTTLRTLILCDADPDLGTSIRTVEMLNRVLSRNLSPIRPPLPPFPGHQKHNVTVRGKCVIYTSGGNGVELRSFQKTLHNVPLARPEPTGRLRGSPKVGIAAKGNRFHKTVGNKGTVVGGRGRQLHGLSVPRPTSFIASA